MGFVAAVEGGLAVVVVVSQEMMRQKVYCKRVALDYTRTGNVYFG
jgi:hypothetical protein